MTDTGLLRQPVEGVLFLSQNFIEPGNNHIRFILTTSKICCRLEIYSAADTYGSFCVLATDPIYDAS